MLRRNNFDLFIMKAIWSQYEGKFRTFNMKNLHIDINELKTFTVDEYFG